MKMEESLELYAMESLVSDLCLCYTLNTSVIGCPLKSRKGRMFGAIFWFKSNSHPVCHNHHISGKNHG